MNNSNNSVEFNTTKLVEIATKNGHNLEGLAKLLHNTAPGEIANNLLEIYFEFTNLLCQNSDYYNRVGDALYTLREVYDAFNQMNIKN